MAENLAHVHWTDLEIAIPCFLIALGMPLTYSISDGLGWGLIIYPVSMLAAKRFKEITPMMWILFFIFVIYFVVLNVKQYTQVNQSALVADWFFISQEILWLICLSTEFLLEYLTIKLSIYRRNKDDSIYPEP